MGGSVMWALVAAVILALGSLMTSTQERIAEADAKGFAAAEAGNLLVYRSFVEAYVRSNPPSAAGSVSDSVLALPAWYSKAQGVSNYVSPGTPYTVYVWKASPPSGEVDALMTATNDSRFVRVAVSSGGVTTLTHPRDPGATALTAPPAADIPQGAVVYVSSVGS